MPTEKKCTCMKFCTCRAWRALVLVLALTACDDRRVIVTAPNGTTVDVKTDKDVAGGGAPCVVVDVKSTAPSIVPLLIPMPIPFAKQPITAEKPAP